jgi:hypothetical protein
VRYYIKSVFEKVGVSSRGELVAKLFAEHYSDPMHAAAVHVPDLRILGTEVVVQRRGAQGHPHEPREYECGFVGPTHPMTWSDRREGPGGPR